MGTRTEVGKRRRAKSAKKRGPDLEWELKQGHPEVCIAGVDEVGRGCLAGPVVAGAIILPAVVDWKGEPWIREITDSKELDAAQREELAPKILAWARASAIGVASVAEIDTINIYHASHLAMERAVAGLGLRAAHVLVDGNATPKVFRGRCTAIVKGDLKCLSIAAASIIAKVWRDRLMAEMDVTYPGYGFGGHKGYSTPVHQAALAALGACAIHRRSFSPVADRVSASQLELGIGAALPAPRDL